MSAERLLQSNDVEALRRRASLWAQLWHDPQRGLARPANTSPTRRPRADEGKDCGAPCPH